MNSKIKNLLTFVDLMIYMDTDFAAVARLE